MMTLTQRAVTTELLPLDDSIAGRVGWGLGEPAREGSTGQCAMPQCGLAGCRQGVTFDDWHRLNMHVGSCLWHAQRVGGCRCGFIPFCLQVLQKPACTSRFSGATAGLVIAELLTIWQ